MRRTGLILAIALCALTAPQAHAATTQQFLDLCGTNEDACVKRIDQVLQESVKDDPRTVFCLPSTMSASGYANEVAYWIGEQSLDMTQADDKSILAALKALYLCKPPHGQPQ